MHLLVDLQSCQSGSRLGGIGRYSLELAKAMARQWQGSRFSVLLNDRFGSAEASVRRHFKDLLPQSDIHVFPAPRNCRYIHDGGVLASDAAVIRNEFIQQMKPDAVHISSLIEGLTEDVVTSIEPDSPWLNAVTVYDLIPLKQPEKYLGDATVRAHYFEKVAQFAHADVLLGISDFSTAEIIDHIGDFGGVAKSILGGIDPRFQPNPDVQKQFGAEFSRLGITRPFLLYTASFDARKNQKGLIEAFARLPRKIRNGYQLVLVGNGWPGVYNELADFGRSAGLADDSLVFPGHISDELLAALYCAAELFVFPSLWEGLGMPVLEAMASGTPSIGSNTTSVPEVLGLKEASFDQNDPSEIAALMKRALTDTNFNGQLRDHAAAHSAVITWEASAKKAIAAIEDAAGRKRGKSRQFALQSPATSELDDLEALSLAEAKRRLANDPAAIGEHVNLGWLTTWDKRCGIASYSMNLIDFIPYDVTVLRQSARGTEKFQTERKVSTVRSWDEGKSASLHQAREAVRKLGMTDVIVQFNYGLFNFEALAGFITDLVADGVNAHIALHSTVDPLDEPGHRLSELADALRACGRVYVHSDHDIERLAKLGVKENVRTIPLGIRRISTKGSKAASGKKAPLTVGSYGFFLPHKGLLELIEAVGILRNSGNPVRLKLVNACYGDSGGVSQGLIDEAQELVAKSNLQDLVEFHTGYESDQDSAALLAECDLIAFPYQQTGESASAAIRMPLAIGKPILTTPLAIFDDLKELVFKSKGCTPEDLAEAIKDVGGRIRSGDEEVKARLDRTARRVAAHDYRGVAEYLAHDLATYSLCVRSSEKFAASQSNVLVKDSTWTGDRWVSTYPGLMMFGPHISLEPGIYSVTIDYRSIRDYGDDRPTVTVTADNSATILSEFGLDQQAARGPATHYFHVSNQREAVEILIRSGNPAAVEIFGYTLAKREN